VSQVAGRMTSEGSWSNWRKLRKAYIHLAVSNTGQ